jgi:hypothetical protein
MIHGARIHPVSDNAALFTTLPTQEEIRSSWSGLFSGLFGKPISVSLAIKKKMVCCFAQKLQPV